jgi:hypothetical protein
VCPGVRTMSQSVSPSRTTCPSLSGSSTVYGPTGWSCADVVAVPVGVHHQREVPGVRAHPCGGLVGVADEAAVNEAGCRPRSRSRLASGNGLCCQVTQVGSRCSSAVIGCLPWLPRRGARPPWHPGPAAGSASLLGSCRHADQGLLTGGHERPLRALDADHLQSAHAERPSGLHDRSDGLEVVTCVRRHEVDLVLHGEHLGLLGEHCEGGVPARAVGDSTGGSGMAVPVNAASPRVGWAARCGRAQGR